MGKRVDFSLGMSSISSGADFGDVYEDRKPKLPPTIRMTAPSPDPGRESKESRRPSRDTESLAPTTSRDSVGKVISSTLNRPSRNRFFMRSRSKLGNPDEGTDLDDLEAGTRDFGINDMPDIPEASGTKWGEETEKEALAKAEVAQAGLGKGRTRAGTTDGLGIRRVDPRSGVVSPRTVQRDGTAERVPSSMAQVRRAATETLARI